ncbi:bacteriophage antitermination protein Q [Escherichia coli]|uniref:bacteriophage antitermination protein Q n=1 Tax=Escherichia coli TaxID=562 RepID=UPI000250D776|nr:bacteriophage antitermination protein Q [Escherichia coli]EHV57891.1 phage antitermination Q family protein [Escherichia coli DEC6B]EHV59992.1 phage antitermination Q family protein [Escherichia coli DEC6A]MCS1315921.1 bacteriophage antitermination protein Q [Escherichia coli]STL44450.1 Putative antiterminator Q [Escherichia coli]
MNTQFLEYVRQQLMVATADLSGATKGQLMAWLENAQFDTGTFKRKKPRVMDEVTGKMITLDNPPIPGKQSHAKGAHIPLVQPVEYSTSSWRRALMTLEEHQKAWLLWNYSENVRWDNQVLITQWAWSKFCEHLAGKKVAKKTIDRLRQLIWLAAQDVKGELSGKDPYHYGDLATLVGVNKTNWSQNYVEHYDAMISLYKGLDSQSLHHISRSRSQQKAANYQQGIAEMN